ncbi:MAG: hypothetical protein R3B70_31575, partial [Polyangiaceae bacterium]
MLRGLPSVIARVLIAATLSFAAAGCEETPPAKDPSDAIDPAEQARIKKSRQKLDAAKEACDLKNYDDARKFLREAAEMNVVSHKFEIDETADRIDKRQAKAWANEAHDLFEAKKCKEAFDQLAEQINGLESEAFTREIRKLTEVEARQCASNTVDSLTTTGKFAEARAYVNAPATVTVLGPTAAKKIATTLDLVIVEALKGQLADEIKEKKWAEALEMIDAAVKKGDATEDIAKQVIATVREGAAPDLAAQAEKAIGTGDAKKTLAALDATIKLLRWEVTAADGTAPDKEKAPPEELSRNRDGLATWVEAQRLNIKMARRAEKKFLHGKFALMPAMQIDAKSKRDLSQGMELWVVGTSKDRALVADSEPTAFSLASMFEKSIG